MKTRFIKIIALVTIAVFSAAVRLYGIGTEPGKKHIGIQLFSARTLLNQDVPSGLEYLSKCGYTTLETYGYNNGSIFGRSTAEFASIAAEKGLSVEASHASIRYNPTTDNLEETLAKWDKLIDDQVLMGCKYIVIANFRYNEGLEGLRLACDYFNLVGKKVKDRGLKLCYHNSTMETGMMENELIIDYLITHTDPDLFFFELDLLHFTEGGLDPVAYLKKYPDRFILLHVSDKDVAGASGTIDMKGVFEQFYANGFSDYFIEVERLGSYTAEDALKLSADFAINSPFIK